METWASSSGIRTPSNHVEAARGHLHAVLRGGLRMSAELVERLPVLRPRVRVRHDAAADCEVGRLANDRRGADRDVPIERAVPGDVADRAGVHAAAVRLEPLDDLPCPGPPGSPDRAARGSGPYDLPGPHLPSQACPHHPL